MIYKKKILLLVIITSLILTITNPIIFAEYNIQIRTREKGYDLKFNVPQNRIINSSKIINFNENLLPF